MNKFRPGLSGTMVRERYRILDEARVAGIVARMQPHRGHHVFIDTLDEVVSAVPMTFYAVAGRGDGVPAFYMLTNAGMTHVQGSWTGDAEPKVLAGVGWIDAGGTDTAIGVGQFGGTLDTTITADGTDVLRLGFTAAGTSAGVSFYGGSADDGVTAMASFDTGVYVGGRYADGIDFGGGQAAVQDD